MYDHVEKPKQKRSRAIANTTNPNVYKQNKPFSNSFNPVSQLVAQFQVQVDLNTSGGTYLGLSNNADTTKSNMDKTFGGNNVKNIFSQHVNKVEGWNIFNCAEPNAFSEMVNSCQTKNEFRDEIQSARMGQASVVDGDPLDRCANCSQWLKGSPASYNNRIVQPLITDLIKKN